MRDKRTFQLTRILAIALAILPCTALGGASTEAPPNAVASENSPSTATSAGEISKLELEIALANLRTEARFEGEAKERTLIAAQATNLEKTIDRQDRTIDRAIATFGIIVSVATLAAALLGLIGFVTVKSRATDEARSVARSEAKDTTDKWFVEHAKNVTETLARLSRELDETKDKAHTIFSARAAEIETLAQQARTTIQNQLTSDTPPTPISNVESLALAESAHAAQAKPAELRNYADWNTSAFEAIRNNDIPAAVLAWTEASKSDDAEEHSRAGALFNAALAQQKRGSHQESIRVADEISKTFGQSDDPLTKVQVAKARITKAVSLRNLGRIEDSISENLMVADGFNYDSHPEMLERVVNARTNAIILMAQTEKLKDAEDQIAKLSDLSENSDALFMRRALAKSMCSLASAFLQAEKWNDCLNLTNRIEARFGKDVDAEVQGWVSVSTIIGSVGLYATGKISAAIARLGSGFNALEEGNEQAVLAAVVACTHLARLMAEAHSYPSALMLYDQLLEITEKSTAPIARNLRSSILIDKSHSLIRTAKIRWSNPEERHENLAAATGCLAESLKIFPGNDVAKANLSYATHLLGGEFSSISKLLKSALEAGDPILITNLRMDIEFSKNDSDSKFLELLNEESKKD